MKIITDESCIAYSSPGHPERPSRISGTLELLRKQKEVPITWLEPVPADEAIISRAHTPEQVSRLNHPGDLDDDTPGLPDIAEHARRSVGGALAALESARFGQHALSLMRPPGHHATREKSMGFCYLNSIAISVLAALDMGFRRVAVFDFDVHHGNGTEDILLNRPGTAFFSVHQSPCYPGTGQENAGRNCFNFPVRPHTPREEYRPVITEALETLKRFRPDLVAVSAGFDAYSKDPIGGESLEAEDFQWIGKLVRDLHVPSYSVLEGGYSDDLPQLILAYLKGLSGI